MRFALWGPTGVRNGWATGFDGEYTHTHTHKCSTHGWDSSAGSLPLFTCCWGIRNSLPPAWGLTAATFHPFLHPTVPENSLSFACSEENVTLPLYRKQVKDSRLPFLLYFNGRLCGSGAGADSTRSTSHNVPQGPLHLKKQFTCVFPFEGMLCGQCITSTLRSRNFREMEQWT